MVRTTRTSAAVKNSAPLANEEKVEPSPPEPAAPVAVATEDTTAAEEDANAAVDDTTAAAEATTTTTSINNLTVAGSPEGSFSSNFTPSIVLQKLPMEQITPSPSSGSARKGNRGKNRPSASVRATRSQQKTSPTTEKDESNDDGLVELIEIIDDDSKSHESSDAAPAEESCTVKLDEDFDDMSCSLILKEPPATEEGSSKCSPKKNECTVKEMDCDIDDTITIVESKVAAVQDSSLSAQVDKLVQSSSSKKAEEDDASSSVSSGPQTSQEGEKSPKAELVGTRKSKRQVKVTNKFRDFVVDAPLPSSQVPYAEIKLARGNGGGRKSHVKEVETFSSSDDLPPESPPMVIRPPIRTYSNKKGKTASPAKLEEEEKPKRKTLRSATPVQKEGRGRKKKEHKNDSLEPEDDTIEMPGPDDRNDSTLTLNIDSSYFTDDEVFRDGTPSPAEFAGWPEEELMDVGAGPSISTLSTMSAFSSNPDISSAAQTVDEDTSGVEESPVVKRRGRPSKVAQPKPILPIVEQTVRPAGSTFIKRSYKTTRSSAGTAAVVSDSHTASTIKVVQPDVPVEKTKSMEKMKPIEKMIPIEMIKPIETPEPVDVPKVTKSMEKLKPVDLPQVTNAQPVEFAKPMDTSEVEGELEDAIEIVLQADEIITNEGESLDVSSVESMITLSGIPKPLRNRRRIRGGTRSSPADGQPRRGRSRRDTAPDFDEDTLDDAKLLKPEDALKNVEMFDKSPPMLMVVDAPLVVVETVPEKTPVEVSITKPEAVQEPTASITEEPETSIKKSPKKSKPRDDSKGTRRDSTSETRKTESKVRRSRTKSCSGMDHSKKGSESVKESPKATPKSPESAEVIILDSKDIIPPVPAKQDSKKDAKESIPEADDKKTGKEVVPVKTPKDSKKLAKDSKDSHKESASKELKKSKESRESSKDSKDRESRKERDSSKSSKDRDKSRRRASEASKKDRRSDVSDLEKKRSDSKESTERKVETDKKRLDSSEKKEVKVDEKKEKPEEKKEKPEEKKEVKPATPVPKVVVDKPKKCFDMELQALDPTPKHGKSSEEPKRSKEQEKSRKSDKHKHRSESESKKKSSGEGKSSKETKSRSTDTSPVPSKHSSSSSKKSSKETSSGNAKKDSSAGSKIRKSLVATLKDEKSKDELPAKKEKVKEKPVEVSPPVEQTPVEVEQPKLEELSVKEEMIVELEVKPEVKEEVTPPEAPRIVTKASRKMYQNEEEILIASSSQESIISEQEVTPEVVKEEPKVEEELQQISEAFDSSVQISGPRPEIALKEFQNISISDVMPVVEDVKPTIEEDVRPTIEEELNALETISPPSQELSNDDSNSNNSSTLDSMKDLKVDQDDATIRRSSRIKTISSKNQRTSGHGLVKDRDKFLKKTTISMGIDSKVLKDAVTGNFNVISAADFSLGDLQASGEYDATVTNIELSEEYLRDMEDKLSRFETIRENLYHCDKVISKEAKKMTCDCFLTNEEIDRGELGCGEDCLNKLLMIECGSRCVVGERCTNKRFQKLEYANCQVFRTEKKGFGIQASTEIAPGEYVMEYVGEVLNSEQFDERAELYSKEKNKHYYFMALRSDAIIDATTKGNISRFINHSCDPNAETQKWTVNGELRIGFFSTKYIMPGEEITFDYQFQRYGRKAQKCYCEAECCTGWIGGDPGSDGESEYEDEEEVEESEEEEETQPEVPAVVPIVEPEPTLEAVKSEEVAESEEIPVVIKPIVDGKPEEPKPVEPVDMKPTEPKPKKVRKRIERPKKQRPRIHEDPDLEKEINNLLKTGLKNQVQTLKLSRLMVRAKDIKSRSRLLTILQSGELPCRRLFLDYHGLKLLYGWICESTESIEDLKFRIHILDTLDGLPIPNKTMLKDSKILQTIEKWSKCEKAKEKEKEKEKEVEKEKEKETSSTSSPSDSNEAGSDSNTSSSDAKKQEAVGNAEVLKNMPELLKLADLGKLKEIISSTCVEKEAEKEKPAATTSEVVPSAASLMDSIEIPEPEDENAPEEKRLGTQIRILSCKLLVSWINLKEVFRIPKKERIEQMKEHEREADLRYKALGLVDDDQTLHRFSASRFFDRSRELKRRKSLDDRDLLNFHKMKRPLSTASPMMKMDNLSKQQRRQMFEMKVAHEEAERRNKELWMQHENNCMKFGLNPHMTAPADVPAKMNPATGEYYSANDRLLQTPPSHMYFKVLPPPMPTNPDDYELPPMDLPPLWKFAIDERGRLYYYHLKDRVPQWEPPKKDAPSRPSQGLRDEDISMSSDPSTTDTEDSEEEHLNLQMEQLLKKKKKQQSSFNLDDVLAKPDDMNDDLSKTIKDLEAGDSSPQASVSAEKLFSDSLEKTAEEMLQHRKRKHSNKLVQERVISPRTEEDKLYGQMEMKRYKETKEKLRRRKEEAKRLRARSMLDKSLSDSPFSGSFTGDTLDKVASESSLIDDDLVVSHKIVEDKCIVDELDILTKKKKISPYEEWQKVKQRLGKKRAAKLGESSIFGGASTSSTSASTSTSLNTSYSKVGKRKKPDKLELNSDEAKKIKEKFRGEIAGVIVQHLSAYRKESCQNGRITNTEDFKHLARKLTHFVLLKELKHCDNTVNELEVTDSVRTKAREFIKKYMAKHGTVYIRGENEPDYANINL